MKRKKIDWKKSPCCGEDVHKVAGIPRCDKCQREVLYHDDRRRPAGMRHQLTKEYREESILPDAPGPMYRELIIE